MFLTNKYSKIYFQLIENRKQKPPEGYSENHHIVPGSLGGNNASSNKVRLTAREHFIAHVLLVRMTTGAAKSKMASAVCIMKGKGSRKDVYFHARLYEHARKIYAASCVGRKMTAASIEKLRQANIGRKHLPRSEEWRIKQRIAQTGRKDPPTGFANRSKAHAGANNPRAKTWVLEREDGSIFDVQALQTWCRENNANQHFLKTRSSFTNGVRLFVPL